MLVLFFYRYLLRGGFLDGREGLVFFVLQAWYRFMVDAKLYEQQVKQPHREIDPADEKIVKVNQC